MYPSTAALRSTTAGRAGWGMELEETVTESMSHLLIYKVALLWNTIASRAISASDLSESDGPYYASAVARTASPSKSSLNISPTAMMTATLLLHRAVDAQQPKHRPLHGSSPPMTMINRTRSVPLTSSLRMRTTSRSALDRSKERQASARGSALRRWHRSSLCWCCRRFRSCRARPPVSFI